MTIKGWRLYYGDGTTFDSTQGSWEDAPATNVQVLSVYYEETYRIFDQSRWQIRPRRSLYHTYDYFFKAPGDVFGCTQAPNIPADASVKLGLLINDRTFQDIYNRANLDVDF